MRYEFFISEKQSDSFILKIYKSGNHWYINKKIVDDLNIVCKLLERDERIIIILRLLEKSKREREKATISYIYDITKKRVSNGIPVSSLASR